MSLPKFIQSFIWKIKTTDNPYAQSSITVGELREFIDDIDSSCRIMLPHQGALSPLLSMKVYKDNNTMVLS